MRVLIAPDKFKGSLSAIEAAECITAGVLAAIPNASIDRCPIADGGEGTVAALLAAHGGRLIHRRVTGPLPEMKVDAAFAMLDGGTAVIEMSAASGLALLPAGERNPMNTTTFGTGELIGTAVAEGAKKIILGLGGSATIDAGIGCAQACGFTILMRDGEPNSMTEPLCGRDLPNVLLVKHGRGEITAGIEITAAADVDNPLCGEQGAARIFGPQKGANPAMIASLDQQLASLVDRTDSQIEALHPGAGAAGGLGFAVLAFFRGKLAGGFDLIAQSTRLSDRLIGVDLCITAEGRIDYQTARGKAVAGVARLCRQRQIPCIAFAGSIETDLASLHEQGLTAAFPICQGPMTAEQSTRDAHRLLTQSACNIARLWNATARPHPGS